MPSLCSTNGAGISVLAFANLFHPGDRPPIKLLLDGQVRHSGGRGCAVPVFHAGGNPYDIALPNLLDLLAPLLNPANASRHD